MGTNYYWHDKPCEHCGRYEDIHVGKSMMTWRAYFHSLLDDEHPDWGYQYESPVGFPILSLADWRLVFTQRCGELWDEYGRKIDDPVAWLDEATAWKPGPDGWKYLDEDMSRGVGWLDPDGFRFYAGEFS